MKENEINGRQKQLLQSPFWQVQGFHAPKDIPYNRVRHIIEGRNGEVWLATWGGGVACLDGHNTKVYDVQTGLLSNKTRKLAMDEFGGIWVCTTNGLNYIQPDGTIHSYTKENFPGSLNANCLSVAIDQEGTVWIGAYDFQLFTIQQNEKQHSFPYQRLGKLYPLGIEEDGGIEDLAFDQKGNLWMGVNGYGIVKLAPDHSLQTWTNFEKQGEFSPHIYDIVLHPQSGIFAGIGQKVYHITEQDEYTEFKGFHTIKSLMPLDGYLIQGTLQGLHSIYYEESVYNHFQNIPLDDSRSIKHIECIAPMSNGNIWVGTQSGVYRISRSIWHYTERIDNFINNGPIYLTQNYANKLILLSGSSKRFSKIYRPGKDTWKEIGAVKNNSALKSSLRKSTNLENEIFYILVSDIYTEDGTSYNDQLNGVYEIHLSNPIQIKKLPHITNYEWYSTLTHKLYHPNRDELWLLYKYGALRWDGERWIKHPQLRNRKNPHVKSMLKTESDTYWFGGMGWVEVWQEGKGKLLDLPETFRKHPATITDIIHHKENIWLATLNGLLIYNQGEWEHLTHKDSLPADDASALLSASDGTLWVGLKSGGVLSYNNGRWIQYGTNDGLNNKTVLSIHEDQFGVIWLYLDKRIASFHPETLPPKVQINTVSETLFPNDRATFSFSAIDGWHETPQDELVYSWRVVDEQSNQVINNWSPYSSAQIINTNPMQPGEYRFEVQSQDKSRNTSVIPAVATFTVAPYLWQKPQFYIPMTGSILVAILSLLIWYKNHIALQISEEKYRTLLDKDATTLVLNWDTTNTLLYCNESASKYFSSIDSSFEQKPIMDWLYQKNNKQNAIFEKITAKAWNNPDSAQNCQLLLSSKNPIWVSWFFRATQARNSNNLEMHAVGVDITQQIEAQSELQREKMSYQEFCDNAQVGIVRFNSKNEIIYMNPSMKEMIEWNKDGDQFPPLKQWAENAEWKSFLWLVRDHNEAVSETLRGTKLNSNEPFYAIASAVRKNGDIDVMVLDYTEQKNLQERIAMTSHYEQEKLGRELHDGLGQQLTSLVYLSQLYAQEVEKNGHEPSTTLEELNKTVLDALEQSRLISKGLNPITLHIHGLKKSLEELFDSYRKVYKPELILKYNDEFLLSAEQVPHAYRIIREAVFNALKHSKASIISVSCNKKSEGMQITIQDNGIGMKQDPQQSKGMGWQIMNFHAKQINSSVKYDSSNPGTKICLLIDE